MIGWLKTDQLSFNHLLLLERVQLSWLPGWLPETELALALKANPSVGWYMRHKCPEIAPWLDRVEALQADASDRQAIFDAEQVIMQTINDLLVYVVDPAIYDVQPFLNWDSRELTDLVDFHEMVVLDIGAGTGRLALVAAPTARVVFAVEPVGNLRYYLKEKARRLGLNNLYPVDGLMTDVPFPDQFADVILSGHTFGDNPEAECQELERVIRPGGVIIHCPGNNDVDNPAHQVLAEHGYTWARFAEPGDGWKRKYWRRY